MRGSSAPNTPGGPEYQFRATGALVESLLLFVLFGIAVAHSTRERLLSYREVATKAQQIQHQLETCDMQRIAHGGIPYLLSLSVVEVVREGAVRIMPTNLLVKDDVIVLRVGQTIPTAVRAYFPDTHPSAPPEDSSAYLT